MKKIFIEADAIAYETMSGIGHATLEIVRAFDAAIDNGHEVTVTVLIPRGTKHIVDRYNFRHVAVKTLPFSQKYLNYLLTRTSAPVPVDLWFGRGVYIFPNYKNWYVPFSISLTFIHDVAFKIFPESTQPKNLAYLQANFNRWLKRASKVLTISESSAKDFRTYFPQFKDKLEVVYLGVDPQFYFPQSAVAINEVLQKYDLPNQYFLYVGNIEPRKNLDRLLDAYEAYRTEQDGKQALVLIGGDGWKNEAIKERVAKLQTQGHPIFWPKQYVPDEDLPALYSGATALIHLALHEGFGLPPVQAQACGTRIIASNLAVFKETLDQAAVTYVDPANASAVALLMSKAPDSGKAKPYGTLTWNATVLRLLQIIDKIA
ncbi:MAG: group 1 glycosyl transferase [Candidatus Saccharibacteria bacterium]|nr:group 1 glycosyl transferase [Candidatus Saccharibacteria bacterium]